MLQAAATTEKSPALQRTLRSMTLSAHGVKLQPTSLVVAGKM